MRRTDYALGSLDTLGPITCRVRARLAGLWFEFHRAETEFFDSLLGSCAAPTAKDSLDLLRAAIDDAEETLRRLECKPTQKTIPEA
jgi:hypothetical protein